MNASDRHEPAGPVGDRGAGRPGGEPGPQAGEPPVAPGPAREGIAEAGSAAGPADGGADQEAVPGGPGAPPVPDGAHDAEQGVEHAGGTAPSAADGEGPDGGTRPTARTGTGATEPGPGPAAPGVAARQGLPLPGHGPFPGHDRSPYGQPDARHPQDRGPADHGTPGHGESGHGASGYGTSGHPGAAGGEAPRPGIVPLRPLGVGEVLAGAVGCIRANPLLTLGVSAVAMVVGQALQLVADLGLPRLDRAALTAGPSGWAAVVLGQLASALVTVALGAVVGGLLLVVLSRAVLGQRITLRPAWQAIAPRLPGLVGLTLLIGLVVAVVFLVPALPALVAAATGSGRAIGLALLLLLGAVAGVTYLTVLWALAPAAYVLEPIGVMAALARSARLVRGAWWRTFGVLMLAAFAVAVPAVVVMGLTGGFAFDPPTPGTAVRSALALTVIGTFATPFGTGVTGLLYVDQRIRRERLDVELTRSVRG